MKYLVLLLAFSSVALAQFENGFVKILEDKRYQEGAAFGNYRNQEDGIKYQEETDGLGVRRGFWEYPDETGKIVRVQFEAGPGIGFRIVNSNIVASTPISNTIPDNVAPVRPVPAAPRTVVKQAPLPVAPVRAPLPVAPVRAPLPVAPRAPLPTPAPEPINVFDYAGNLDFSRHAGGHSFKFTAV